MLLFYIRHGDPIYDPDSLTPLGLRQAEAIGKRLAMHGIDRIFTSTSNRAILTAKPTCELLKKDFTQLDFCNEKYAWDELTTIDSNGSKYWLFESPEMKKCFVEMQIQKLGFDWYKHDKFSGCNYEYGINRIQKGTDEFLKSLGYEHIKESGAYRVISPNSERVALFAHQGFGIAFLSCLLDIPYPQFSSHFDMSHSGMTVIEFKDNDAIAIPRVLMLASDGHLYKEGLPTKYHNITNI